MHRHRCGLRSAASADYDPPEAVIGCGYMWEHVKQEGVTDEVYAQGHMCPNCNVGPWYTVVKDINDVLRVVDPPPPVIGMGVVLRPNPDNPSLVPKEDLLEFLAYAREHTERHALHQTVERVVSELFGSDHPGIQVVVFDEENRSISGFEVPASRRRRR